VHRHRRDADDDPQDLVVIPPAILMAAVAVGVLGTAASVVLVIAMRRQQRVAQRLLAVRGVRRKAARPDGSVFLNGIAALGSAVARSGILSSSTIGELERTLESSGLHGRNGIGLFIGSKLLLFTGLPGLAALLLPHAGFSAGTIRIGVLAGAAVGLLLPDMVVRRNHQKYLDKVDAGVADALDMLVICAQAGLGLETAMHRVAAEIVLARPEIAAELETTLKEMRIAVDSQRALTNLGARTGLLSLKRVTATLVQTMRYGTPLTDALRVLSAEMRQETLTKFEARAARLPVLLTMPMIMFIFPCIFIVMAGPAAMQLAKTFSHSE
jgi:tight adherence protein C